MATFIAMFFFFRLWQLYASVGQQPFCWWSSPATIRTPWVVELVSKRIWLVHLNKLKQRVCSTTQHLNCPCLWQASGCCLWSSSLSQTRRWAAFLRNTFETFIVGCHDHNYKWQRESRVFLQTWVESEKHLVVLKQLPLCPANWGGGMA